MLEIEKPDFKEETRALLQKYIGRAILVYIWPRNSKDIPDTEEFKPPYNLLIQK